MKQNLINEETLEGRLYSQNLQLKTVNNSSSPNNGKEYISGTIDIATDDKCENIVQNHYTFVTATTKSGKTNASFTNLKKIMEESKTVVEDGADKAEKIRLTPAADLNDFYPQGQDTLVSTPKNEGGFVSILRSLKPEKERNKFKFDVIINGTQHVDADPEKNIPKDYVIINAAIFNFRHEILPFPLVARSEGAINYFESLETPCFTQVWGKIENQSVVTKKVTESAFGEDAVDTITKHIREWVVTGAQAEPYEFDSTETITAEEVKQALADREVKLADTKKRSEEYYASKEKNDTAPAAVPQGGFDF